MSRLMVSAVADRNITIFLGGRNRVATFGIRTFLEKLSECAELVFVFAHDKCHNSPELSIDVLESQYITTLNTLDVIDECNGHINIAKDKKRKAFHLDDHGIVHNLLRMCKNLGEILILYDRSNQQVMQYVFEHKDKVLAIIADNTEYLMYGGSHQLWWSHDLNLKAFSVTSFNADTTIKHFDLTKAQMQLLYVLTGTQFLPYEVLRNKFFGRIYLPFKSRFESVVNYVRNQEIKNPTSSNECNMFDIEKIATDVFGPNATELNKNNIINSFASVNLNFKLRDKHENPAIKCIKETNPYIYEMLAKKVFVVSDIAYVDLRPSSKPNYSQLLMPILRKCFGVLFANCEIRPKTKEVLMKYSHDKPYEVVEEMIEYPSGGKQLPHVFMYQFFLVL